MCDGAPCGKPRRYVVLADNFRVAEQWRRERLIEHGEVIERSRIIVITGARDTTRLRGLVIDDEHTIIVKLWRDSWSERDHYVVDCELRYCYMRAPSRASVLDS